MSEKNIFTLDQTGFYAPPTSIEIKNLLGLVFVNARGVRHGSHDFSIVLEEW